MKQYNECIETPLGLLEVTADAQAVKTIYFVDHQAESQVNKITKLAIAQLKQYFAGERRQFDLPLAPEGTSFQQQVWQALLTIKYGDTCSYSDIANQINNPKAVRAVGAANGRNPLTIVVPCHRVVGRNGALTGYAFGIERKSWLLNHESDDLFS